MFTNTLLTAHKGRLPSTTRLSLNHNKMWEAGRRRTATSFTNFAGRKVRIQFFSSSFFPFYPGNGNASKLRPWPCHINNFIIKIPSLESMRRKDWNRITVSIFFRLNNSPERKKITTNRLLLWLEIMVKITFPINIPIYNIDCQSTGAFPSKRKQIVNRFL